MRTAAISLSSRSACQASSVTCSKPAPADVPALFSRMSTAPNCRMAAATTESHPAAWETSATTGKISAPVAFLMSSRARSSTSLRRAQAATRAPERANRSTAARPSPSLPPVTIATLPLSPSSRVSMARKDSRLTPAAHTPGPRPPGDRQPGDRPPAGHKICADFEIEGLA